MIINISWKRFQHNHIMIVFSIWIWRRGSEEHSRNSNYQFNYFEEFSALNSSNLRHKLPSLYSSISAPMVQWICLLQYFCESIRWELISKFQIFNCKMNVSLLFCWNVNGRLFVYPTSFQNIKTIQLNYLQIKSCWNIFCQILHN